ncbi:pyruvate dehydrogenase E2 component (dihydrolipoamide acetyltransferase) [Microbulbifer donghaiensis]|uniref:Acetyltransferase component of pyruvate dehydrogenase complex n=1 Tax=Microbulbifer donghaiensis TaxID=494016 RepID=A0A1M5CUK8_9GAMM|nr:dihydrolipoyllysine-residue acetyltransferase [Microbulbifer donghaiensis]SHF58448.1 pyruvate dehydrogenase E2 component (dihydrolipoamide acetyltransferase) [Microbulbifer donghaiensis]
MAKQVIKVPDLGGADQVDVIEISVAVGDTVAEEDALIVVEGDKASMDVPAPVAGKILSLSIKEGDKVSEGDVIGEIETDAGAAEEEKPAAEPEKEEPAEKEAEEKPAETAEAAPAGEATEQEIKVPDLGGADAVDVIEITVAAGDEVGEGDSLIVVEGDKASMDVPSPAAGTIVSISVKEGDKVSTGDVIGVMKTVAGGAAAAPAPAPAAAPEAAAAPQEPSAVSQEPSAVSQEPSAVSQEPPAAPQKDYQLERDLTPSAEVYAGPAVRKLARELGVTLNKVKPTGPRNRVTKDDLHAYIKEQVKKAESGAVGVGGGIGIAPMPDIDFSQFGPVNVEPMTKIHKITAANMSRNWLNVPHVTQFDDADITELEDFRKSMKAEAEKRGVKLTPVPFLLKAVAAALRAEPSFNVSLHNDGEHIVRKDYVHVGMAVDTPKGLMVPVIRDVDKKGLYELAEEATAMALAARDGKLKPRDMQGACFTISSLGAIGGTGFTPIVNSPEVGILGVSKLAVKPVWNGKEFVPRQMLPLTLSYDHRAVNGGDAGRFMTYLVGVLGDVRRLLL